MSRAGRSRSRKGAAVLLRARGECPSCGYSLRGLGGSRCPECGTVLWVSDRRQGRRSMRITAEAVLVVCLLLTFIISLVATGQPLGAAGLAVLGGGALCFVAAKLVRATRPRLARLCGAGAEASVWAAVVVMWFVL